MTLPSSGAISMAQMRDEFGLGNPVSMSQMWGKGGAQGSGAISFADMRGRSNTATWSHNAGTVSASGVRAASLTLSCSVPCNWSYTRTQLTGTSSPGNGSSNGVTSVTFSIPTSNSGQSSRWTVTATPTNGQPARSWTVQLNTDGIS